ncbi:hypothetical protein C5B42_02705 [Candidatus Cerribacteria bacterium 'Amazon FNV 2010 28 9']|uniref:YdhG-like domain-containing protein n=1 Tax=Candidatus Cerribacteria bacterium 'Amazon FNV 2010 28 9' TaxID=2081795 RepID=A0A317JQD2_9BACT|nr:MAG: hypothetical protein C5B42_02705 [Candidatus Cerribacteria bacterium 'Amazon FNV 2010 28 9']
MPTPKSVDEYLESVPSKFKQKLQDLRDTIRSAAPNAQEKISYGMPYYDYKGRLAYFRLATHHIGLYIPGPILKEFASELQAYETTDATLRLPLDMPLPKKLIGKFIKARMKLNEQHAHSQ